MEKPSKPYTTPIKRKYGLNYREMAAKYGGCGETYRILETKGQLKAELKRLKKLAENV
jgi:hypothetical protein